MSGKVLMKGNEAIAEAAIKAGCRLFFGYPITPQTEISEYMAKKMPKVGGLCLQAESEVAAINMVLGAASTGERVITSSSSPGISLKSEGISYLIGSDLPCVIVNIQRGGPGLGGIQPAQSDYYQATRALGHGDGRALVFAPASVQEMASLTMQAFDLSDCYRMPAMILGDGALGQMMEPVDFAAVPRRDIPEKDWSVCAKRGETGYRTVNSLYIRPEELEQVVKERFDRYETIKKTEVKYEEFLCDDADMIVVAYGIPARIVKTAVLRARERGIKAGCFRPVTLWPFPSERLRRLAEHTKAFLAVELSMGQMIDDLRIATEMKKPCYFYGRTGGMMPTVGEIEAEMETLSGGLQR